MEKPMQSVESWQSLSARLCQSVIVIMTGQQQQQWEILNSLVHEAAHRGFTCWQTEPRAVLSTACQQLCLSRSNNPPSCCLYLHAHSEALTAPILTVKMDLKMNVCTLAWLMILRDDIGFMLWTDFYTFTVAV